MNQPINLLLKFAAYGLSCGLIWSWVAPSASAEIRWMPQQHEQIPHQSLASRSQ